MSATLIHFLLVGDEVNWVKLIPAFIIGGIWLLGVVSAVFKKAAGPQKTPIVPIAPFTPRMPPSAPPLQPRTAKLVRPAATLFQSRAAKLVRPSTAPSQARAARLVKPPIGRPGTLAKKRTDGLFASRQADAIRQMLTGFQAPSAKRREPAPPKPRQSVAQPVAPIESVPVLTRSSQTSCLVDGRALARRMQPALLRYQFILTEVLRPPVALREEWNNDGL